ncbi:DUF1302 domain-containing protein [Variovorax sp. GT1P44]|uniref:DUF1302 domain-containing protein n=1 Tax=Variovorax sp. GT1P44 TaxID=3443742 RepID=UPI003F4634F3
MGATVLCLPALGQTLGAVSPESTGSAVKWTFDGELSQGLVWRTSRRNQELVGPSHGGLQATDLQDDGNLNSDRGTLVSSPTTALGTLEAQYKNHRVLLRASYAYDGAVMNTWNTWGLDKFPGTLRSEVRDAVGSRAQLLDAYYAGDFDLQDAGALEFKLGRQTIMWGEAKFLPGGINMFNPIESWKSHAAGVSLKEMVLPVAAAGATWQLNPTVSFQGFYQLEKLRFEYDPVGTLFSDNDILGAGAGTVGVVPGAPPLYRGPDPKSKTGGQYGLASFLNLDGINLGFYFQNLQQRAAKVSGVGLNGVTSYFWEFPNDVKTLGTSFSTALGSAAFTGELAYRHDTPIGLDPNAVGAARTNAALCGAILGAPANCGVDFGAAPFNIPVPPLASTPLRAQANGYVQGWTRVDQWALNLGLTQAMTGSDFLPRLLGANGGLVAIEANAIHSGLPNQFVLPTAVKGPWTGSVIAQAAVDYYRVGGSSITVTPRLVLQTWVFGDDPTQAPFFKGRLNATAAVQLRHEQKPDWSLEFAYTNISDHTSRGNLVLSDRDYFSMLAKWAF